MALINFARREIEVKIVFYGPALSGKTTNVEVLHRLMPPAQRGELHSLRTEQDRTLFFDYAPLRLGEIAGFTARFKVFTVPGQIYYKETRRVVLQGADAIVFVADSSPARAAANVEALVDLEDNLRLHGLDLASIPLVVQLNKRDVPGAVSVEAMSAELNPFGVPVIEAVASEGRGVLDTLRRVTDIAAQRIRENLSGQSNALPLTAIERAAPEDERQVVRDHMDAIRAVRPGEEEAVRRLRAAGQMDAGQVDAVLSGLVVRSEDVTPPEPIDPLDGPFDEMPVPRDPVGRPAPRVHGGLAGLSGLRGEATPVRGLSPPMADAVHGVPLDAWVAATGATFVEVRAAGLDFDGAARLELVADWHGERRRHMVTLRIGTPPPAAATWSEPIATPHRAPPPEPGAREPAEAPRGHLKWVAFGGAAVFAAVGGMALGVGLGWIAFAG